MVWSWISRCYDRPYFQRLEPAIGAGDVIRWWEGRRLVYNLVVGCTGLMTFLLLAICALTADSMVGEPIGMPDGPLLGIFAFVFCAIPANIFYTVGWIAELIARASANAADAAAVGLRAFRLGVTVTILLTLSPAVLCWLAFAVALVRGQKHGPIGE